MRFAAGTAGTGNRHRRGTKGYAASTAAPAQAHPAAQSAERRLVASSSVPKTTIPTPAPQTWAATKRTGLAVKGCSITTQPRPSSSSRRSVRTRAWLVEPTSRGTASRPKRLGRSVTWGEQPRHPLPVDGRERRQRGAHGAAGETDGVHRGLHPRGAELAHDLLVQRNERLLEGGGADAVPRAEGRGHVGAAPGGEAGEREDPAVAAQLQRG